MHFGLFSLMAQRDRAITARQLYEETVEQVKLAEAIGFDIAWFAEHPFSNYCLCPSPITMATCLAPQTTRIRLGTAVVVAPLYHPLRMLEDLGMLDVVSNGRAVALDTARDTFLETLQPTHISCFMALPNVPQARTLRSMERFGAEVIPALDRHFGGLARIGRPAQ